MKSSKILQTSDYISAKYPQHLVESKSQHEPGRQQSFIMFNILLKQLKGKHVRQHGSAYVDALIRVFPLGLNLYQKPVT